MEFKLIFFEEKKNRYFTPYKYIHTYTQSKKLVRFINYICNSKGGGVN